MRDANTHFLQPHELMRRKINQLLVLSAVALCCAAQVLKNALPRRLHVREQVL